MTSPFATPNRPPVFFLNQKIYQSFFMILYAILLVPILKLFVVRMRGRLGRRRCRVLRFRLCSSIMRTPTDIIMVPVWGRRRVSLLNYKGGSGRIWGGKLNENIQNHHQRIIFSTKFFKCQKNQKMDVEKNKKIK